MANYKSSYTGAEIDAGIAKANTALQEHQDISGKVDKETGKGLSTNDYTTAEKTKLAGIDMSTKQDTLVSGTNIKTINNTSILGSGNIEIGSGGTSTDVQINGTSITSQGEANIVTEGTYNASTNKIATMNDLPDVSTKQDKIDSSHKLSADLIQDGSTNKVVTSTEKTTWSGKQDTLVSGTNIKTINNQSIVGEGNITISGDDTPEWSFTSDYETELTRVINKVKGYQDNKSKYNTSFIVFTDCHTNTTSAHPELDRMLQAINYLTRELDIKFVANLGDTVNNPGTSGSMDVYPYIVNKLKATKAPYINLMGNHDWVASVYKRNYATNFENAAFDKKGGWFYVDDEKNDIRYICLDCQDRGNDANSWTTVTTTQSGVTDHSWLQLNWLANTALKTNKRVVILSHQSLGSSQSDVVASTTNTANYFLAKDLLSAFENGVSGTLNYTTYYPAETTAHSTISYDFTGQGAGRLLCCLEGHTHGDMDWSYSGISSYPTPFNEIWFDDALCNAQTYIGKANTKTINTVNEIAFDVVTLDLINEKVYCTRFGTGDDRELTLRASQGIPVTAITVNAETSYNATTFTPTATLTPSNTTQTGITWSITSGSTYASINSSTGVVTVLSGASSNSITVKATSTANSSVYGTKNITVTYPTEPVPLTALAINAESSYTGTEFTPTVTYTPSNTTQTGVTWSITSGGEYATINSSTGVVTIDEEADGDEITITATSTENSSITATKNVTVTYENLPADVDITNQFTFTAGGPVGYGAGWTAFDENNPKPGASGYPSTNPNLTYSNFVNIEGYTSLTITNVKRASGTATGGWAFYGSNDLTDTVTLNPAFVSNGTTITTAPAQFIQDGSTSRNHNSTQDGVQTDTITIPAGAKYIRVSYWANNGATYNTPFSCVAHR